MNQVKDYIEHLHWHDSDKLKEILPECVFKKYKNGDSYVKYNNQDVNRIKMALSGNININGTTFRVSQVSHIQHIVKDNTRIARVILQDGTRIETYNDLDREIICAIFGYNKSERCYTS